MQDVFARINYLRFTEAEFMRDLLKFRSMHVGFKYVNFIYIICAFADHIWQRILL
jgi:hypothetical protein